MDGWGMRKRAEFVEKRGVVWHIRCGRTGALVRASQDALTSTVQVRDFDPTSTLFNISNKDQLSDHGVILNPLVGFGNHVAPGAGLWVVWIDTHDTSVRSVIIRKSDELLGKMNRIENPL